MTLDRHFIDEHTGDSAAPSKTDFDEAVAEGRLLTVQWNDLLTDAVTLPHMKDTGRGYIKLSLGYLPPDDVMLPFEPYLRALIQLYWQNAIEEDEFLEQAEDHIKLIRNADMKHNTGRTYDPAIYQNYKKTYLPYGYAVKSRLTRFLGYEPQLEHSLIAELWMRDIMADDSYQMPDEITHDDIRAMTLIKYREILLKEGRKAADDSHVMYNYYIDL